MTAEQVQEQIQEQVEELDDSRSLVGRLGHMTRRYVYAGVGAVSVLGEKASDLRHGTAQEIDRLAARGESVRERRLRRLSDGAQTTRDMAAGVTRQVSAISTTVGGYAGRARDMLGIASAEDVDAVIQQIDVLNEELDAATNVTPEG